MEQRLDGEEKKDHSLGESLSDPVEDLLLYSTDSDAFEFDEEREFPIFEGFGTALAAYKSIVWCFVALFLLVPIVFMQKVISDWTIFGAICASITGGALVFTLVRDPSYVRVYKDRIEWRNWGRIFEASEYSVRFERIEGRVLIRDLDGTLVGKLPQIYPSNVIELLVSLHNLGISISLPQRGPWASFSKAQYIYDSNPINLASMLVMLIPALGIFGSLSLALIPSALTNLWPWPIPISLALAVIVHKSTKRQAPSNRYEFSRNQVSKVKSGKTIWTVLIGDVRHIGFAAHGDSCQFVLVTHYGRKYSLPSSWKVALPFAIWQDIKLVHDEEIQAQMEKPINFKRIGL